MIICVLLLHTAAVALLEHLNDRKAAQDLWERDGKEVRLTFCVVLLVVWVEGLVKVIFTGDMCGRQRSWRCSASVAHLGLPLTGTVMVLGNGA